MIVWHSLDKQMHQSLQVSEWVRHQIKCDSSELCGLSGMLADGVDGVETPVWIRDGVCSNWQLYAAIYPPWSKLQVINQRALNQNEEPFGLLSLCPN